MGELNIAQQDTTTWQDFGSMMDEVCHGYTGPTEAEIQAQMQQDGAQHDTQMRVIQEETHALESDTRSNHAEATPADRAEGVTEDLQQGGGSMFMDFCSAFEDTVRDFADGVSNVKNELPAAEPEQQIDFTNQDVRMALREQNVLYTKEAEHNMNNPSPGGPGMGGMA